MSSFRNILPPKDAAFAAESVEIIKREAKSASARRAMAELAVKHGNYIPEGIAVWQRYLDDGAPAA